MRPPVSSVFQHRVGQTRSHQVGGFSEEVFEAGFGLRSGASVDDHNVEPGAGSSNQPPGQALHDPPPASDRMPVKSKHQVVDQVDEIKGALVHESILDQ